MNSWLSSTLAEQLGWVVLHSLWQGCVIAVALFALLYVCRRGSSELRYGLSLGALVLMLAAPLATWMVMDTPPSSNGPGSETAVEVQEWPAAGLDAAAGEVYVGYDAEPEVAADEGSFLAHAVESRAVLPWMGTAWAAGVVLYLAHLAGGWCLSQRLRYSGTVVPPADLYAGWQDVANHMGIGQCVDFKLSERVTTPLTMGWWKPVVLMPVSVVSGLPPEQLRAIIAHELAHIRRYDYAVNAAQSVLEVLFFYHPAAWWISRQVREEREHCCDDIAKDMGGPLVYGRALATLSKLGSGADRRFALAATEGRLLHRIRRLFQPDVSAQVAGSRLAPVAFVALAAVALAGSSVLSGHLDSDSGDGSLGAANVEASDVALVLHDEFIPSQTFDDLLAGAAPDARVDTTDSSVVLPPAAALPETGVRVPADTLDLGADEKRILFPALPGAPFGDLDTLRMRFPSVDSLLYSGRSGISFGGLDTLRMRLPNADSLSAQIQWMLPDSTALPNAIDLENWPGPRVRLDTLDREVLWFKRGEELEEEMAELRREAEEVAREAQEQRRKLIELHREEHKEQIEEMRRQIEEQREAAQEQARQAREEAKRAREELRQQLPAHFEQVIEELQSQREQLEQDLNELRRDAEERELTEREERKLELLQQHRDRLDGMIESFRERLERMSADADEDRLEDV